MKKKFCWYLLGAFDECIKATILMKFKKHSMMNKNKRIETNISSKSLTAMRPKFSRKRNETRPTSTKVTFTSTEIKPTSAEFKFTSAEIEYTSNEIRLTSPSPKRNLAIQHALRP